MSSCYLKNIIDVLTEYEDEGFIDINQISYIIVFKFFSEKYFVRVFNKDFTEYALGPFPRFVIKKALDVNIIKSKIFILYNSYTENIEND